jgi:uncharacterized membrane protein YkvA (DUF1232 family)
MDNGKKVVDTAVNSSKVKSIAKDQKKIKKVLKDAGVKSDDLKNADGDTIKSGLGFLFALATFQAEARSSTYFLMLAGVVYFVFPVDVILDFIPVIGFVDDVFIMALILKAVKTDYEKYLGDEVAVKSAFEMYTAGSDDFEVRTVDEDIDTSMLVNELYEVMDDEGFDMNQLVCSSQVVEYSMNQFQDRTLTELSFSDDDMSQIIYQMLINIPFDKYTINTKRLAEFFSLISSVDSSQVKEYIMRYKTYERNESRIDGVLNLEFVNINNDDITIKVIQRVECDDLSYSYLFPLESSETILFNDHFVTFMQYNLKTNINGFVLIQMLLFNKLCSQVSNENDLVVQRFIMNNNIIELESPTNSFKVISLAINDYFFIEDLNLLFKEKCMISFINEENDEQ